MKKFFMCAVAVAATMSLASCMNEEDMFKHNGIGTINLNITNDNLMVTRAVGVPSDLTANWIVTVRGQKASPYEYTKNAGTALETTLNGVPADTYDIVAKSAASEVDATSDTERGTAFWSGSASGAVTAGGTLDGTVVCGKPQNGKIEVTFSDDFTTAFPTYNLAATVGETTINFNSTYPSAAFFAANAEVSYVLTYGNSSVSGRYPVEGAAAKTITVARGTAHKLKFSTNNEGKITLSITYDDEFTEVTAESVEFDANSGSVVVPAP